MSIELVNFSVGCVLATILLFLSVKFALSFTPATDHSNSKSSAQQSTSPCLSFDPSGTTTTFTHTPLKHPRHFRILHLTSSLCGKDQILHGTLVETSLDNVPQYLAMSYVWGDPSPRDIIFIDEKPLKITQSCGAGLRRMLKGKFEIKIWVDAICINQAGDTQAVEERSTQVSFMDEIYSKAVQVNVHLGEGDKKTDEAMKAAKGLAAASRAALWARKIRVGQGVMKRRYGKAAEQVLQSSLEFPRGKLHPLFRLPWFDRVWVFQEVVLARKVVFCCGEHIIAFEDLVSAADFGRVPHSNKATLRWILRLKGYVTCIHYLHQKEQGEDVTLANVSLILKVMQSNATRPEDNIHGMYGYAKKIQIDWPIPDYTKSVAQVYTEATFACFRQTNDLWIMLMAIGPASGEFGLPSWVPDYSKRFRFDSPLEPPKIGVWLFQNKRSSGASRCDWTVMPGGRQLGVKGRKFDYIAEVGETWCATKDPNAVCDAETKPNPIADDFIDCVGSWYNVVLQRSKILNRGTGAAHHLEAVFELAHLLVSGQSSLTQPPEHFVEILNILTSSTGKHEIAFCLYSMFSKHDGDIIETRQPLVEVVHHIITFVWHLIFRTTEKSCIGIVNGNAKAGDLLVVIHGMTAPCLIRPCTGGFHFIGAAFVDEITNGEFWKAGSSEDDEWFTLI